MKYAAILLAMTIAMPLWSLEPKEMTAAANAAKVLAADDGSAFAIIPSDAQAGGAGIYVINCDGEICRTLLEPAHGLASETARYMVCSPTSEDMWAVSSCSILGQPPKERVYRLATDGTMTEYGVGIVDEGSDIALQRLLPLSEKKSLYHDGDAVSMCHVICSGTDIVRGDTIYLPDDCGFRPALASEAEALFYPIASDGTMQLVSFYLKTGRTDVVLGMLGRQSSYLDKNTGIIEKDDKLICAVASSADGGVLAFRWANGDQDSGTLGVHVAILRKTADGSWPEEVTLVDESHSNGDYRPVCGDFAISDDGRMVAFCAPDDAVPHRMRAWRYDSVTGVRVCVSDGVDADCSGISISPNGRFVAFIADGMTYRADCGMDLRCEADRLKIAPGTQNIVVPLVFHGALPGERATMTIRNENACPGGFMVDGRSVDAGCPFEVTCDSTIRYLPGDAGQGEGGIAGFELLNANGLVTGVEVEMAINGYDELARVLDGSFQTKIVPDLALDADKKKLFADIMCGFHECEDGGIFAIELAEEHNVTTLASMENEKRLPVMAVAVFSGDVMALDNHGGLLLDSVQLAADGFAYQVTPAIAADGARMAAARTNGAAIAVMDRNGVALREIDAQDGSAVVALRMDYPGRRVFWLENSGALRTVACDGDGEPVTLQEDVTELLGVTADGSRVFYRGQEGKCWLRILSCEEALPVAGIPESASGMELSANGCYVCWQKDDSNAIAFLEYDDDGVLVRLASAFPGVAGARTLSADGEMLAFVGSMANFSKAGSKGTGLYLYTLSNWSKPASPVPLWDDETHVLEDETANLMIAYSGDAVCLTQVNASPEALHGDAEVLPPGMESPYVRLRYTPAPDYAGPASFQVRFWNGNAWSEWKTCAFTVDNVNDPPEWKTQFPVEKNIEAGCVGTIQLEASDPDSGDRVRYQLKLAPEWVSVDAESGVVTLEPPMDVEPGTCCFLAEAVDLAGESTGDGGIVAKVSACSPQMFTLEELLTSAGGETMREGSAAAWHASVCGCWAFLKESAMGWKALSLPGDVECADICAILGGDCVWRWQEGRWQRQQVGAIPGGVAFWCNASELEIGGSVLIKPVFERTLEVPGFYGPLVKEKLPEGAEAATPTMDGWLQKRPWQIGRGAFVRL